MPTYSNWLKAGTRHVGGFDYAPDYIINRDAVSLVLGRGATNLAAQTVRIVPADAGQPSQSSGAGDSASADADVIVIGGSAFDVARGDFFKYLGTRYEVIYVEKTLSSKIEAKAKARQ